MDDVERLQGSWSDHGSPRAIPHSMPTQITRLTVLTEASTIHHCSFRKPSLGNNKTYFKYMTILKIDMGGRLEENIANVSSS